MLTQEISFQNVLVYFWAFLTDLQIVGFTFLFSEKRISFSLINIFYSFYSSICKTNYLFKINYFECKYKRSVFLRMFDGLLD